MAAAAAAAEDLQIPRDESPVVFVRKRKRSVDLEESPAPPSEAEPALPPAGSTEDSPDSPPLLDNDRVHWEATRNASVATLSDDFRIPPRTCAKRSRAKDVSVDAVEMFALPPSAIESTSSGSMPFHSDEDCVGSTSRPSSDLVPVPMGTETAPLDSNTVSEDLPLREHGDSSPRKRPISFAKPVEIRVAGSGCQWERLPTLKRAHEVSGLATDVIKALCESQSEHLGWECRWPLQPPSESETDPSADAVPAPCDVGDLAQRIRKIPGAARRRLLAALPVSIRGALAEHLKASPLPSPEVRPAKEPDLNDIISDLPEVLRQVPQDVRCKVLAGLRSMGERLQAMLVAPDVATIASLIKEAAPAHRKTLMEALPQETQKALMEHKLAEKNGAATKAA
mmetsp:Transcript_119988/g.188233  ORF Transcript_119988/g.188233 Transcript_119988/m.188233 type:complete len:396 (-) Transcript_119988:60-1247(-)